MANSFTRFPQNGGDNGVWGPLLLANLRDLIGLNSCKLYDDSGTLKISQGKIGINDNTNEGIMTIDTITTISIAGISNSNWAQIEVELSGSVPVFSATDIAGATDSDFLPSTLTDAYSGTKDGFYINATKRTMGAIYKDGSGNLAFVVNCNIGGEQVIGDKFHSVNDVLLRAPITRFSYRNVNSGGTATTGAWGNLALNYTDFNYISGISLASNQITLPKGKYHLRGYCNFYQTAESGCKIRDITNSADLLVGNGVTVSASDTGIATSNIEGVIEVSATTIIEFQYSVGRTVATFGLGICNGFVAVTPNTEFRAITITKIA